MAMIKGGDFDLPMEYMTYIPTKAQRNAYFKDILAFYKKEFPNFKLIYAYLAPLERVMRGITNNLMWDTGGFSLKIDYLLIFKVPSKNKGKSIYIIENPLFSTNRSCVGFQYCKEKGMLDVFKNTVIETTTRMTEFAFTEFIYQMSFDELVENFNARESNPRLKAFYDNLPRKVRMAVEDKAVNHTEETIVLDANAAQFVGATSMDPNFWKSEENREALLTNSIILSMYYNKPQG